MGCLQKECCPGWFFQLHRTELSVKRRICPSVPQALCCVWTLPPPVPHKVRKSWMHKDHLSPRLNFHTVASLWTKISTTYFRPEMIYSYLKKKQETVFNHLWSTGFWKAGILSSWASTINYFQNEWLQMKGTGMKATTKRNLNPSVVIPALAKTKCTGGTEPLSRVNFLKRQ